VGKFTGDGSGLTNLNTSGSATAVNPIRIALNRWYSANQVTAFSCGGAGPIGMAFDGANIWVADIGSNQVTKIRASDGYVTGTFSSLYRPRSICFDGANIWVTGEPTGLQKIRASDGTSLATNSSVPPSYFACLFDGTNVWTCDDGSSLYKINTADASIVTSYNCGIYLNGAGLVFDGAYLWTAGYDSYSTAKVVKVRPSDGAVIGTYTVGKVGNGVGGITFDGQNIWVANFSGGTVIKLKASDGTILGTYNVTPQPFDILFDGTDIWVSDLNHNTVSRVRQSDGTVFATYTVSSPFRLAFDGANVWVSDSANNLLHKL